MSGVRSPHRPPVFAHARFFRSRQHSLRSWAPRGRRSRRHAVACSWTHVAHAEIRFAHGLREGGARAGTQSRAHGRISLTPAFAEETSNPLPLIEEGHAGAAH